jgi:ApbE superfamily uncharacterized protein (UPF0280 family)
MRVVPESLPAARHGNALLAMYQPRLYRHGVNVSDLVSYTVQINETDLFIRTCTDLSRQAAETVKQHRAVLQNYIVKHPFFAATFEPIDVAADAPHIVKRMATAARTCGVGPMAAVAGAMAQAVGEELSRMSPEVIVENGGDNYLRSTKQRIVSIFAGESSLTGKIGLVIPPDLMPIGVCTSSATVGPSISLGKADAAVIAAKTAELADAAATAVGNTVLCAEDIPGALDIAKAIEGVLGAVIIIGDKLGAWGCLEICPLGSQNQS